MPNAFSLPKGSIGRFAVVKLWPDIKTAEDECIARLKLAALTLGIECIEIHADGSLLSSPETKITKKYVDFVIHLHYDTPKRYDAFSLVALWNPLKFYHEWGYARCSRNLTTHDDFLSCSSAPADHHVARMVRETGTHLPAQFNLYHSTPDLIHRPSLGDGKLFYAGINWEAISGGKSRHQEVLKRLDKTGFLRIYGPKIFQGVEVWAGYESYVKEVPFDGISMIDEIAKAGVALVLSSQAHKDSALMSNRLFESVSAGALVICDENPFAKKFFGDSLLYIDGRSPVDQLLADIAGHLEWAKANPEKVLAMVAKAQAIFSQRFGLVRNIADLYNGLQSRKRTLSLRQNPLAANGLNGLHVQLNLLMPEYSEKILQAHLHSVSVQEYTNITSRLIIDAATSSDDRKKIEDVLIASGTRVVLVNMPYWKSGIHPEIKSRRLLGEVMQDLLESTGNTDAFMVVAPNETLFSNHISVLAGALQRNTKIDCAATAAVLINGDAPIHDVHEVLDFGHVNRVGPPGYGRFIFRLTAVPKDIGIALPYLDGRPLAVMIGNAKIDQQLPASISIDIHEEFPPRHWDEVAETEIIRSYCPDVLNISVGFRPRQIAWHQPTSVAMASRISRRLLNRRWLRAQLEAVRTQGLYARIQVLRRKAGL